MKTIVKPIICLICIFSLTQIYGAKLYSQQELSTISISLNDSIDLGNPISFRGKGGNGQGGYHAPIGPGYISPVDAYFIAYAIGEQLLFVNSLDYMQYVPFTIEDESGETVEASSVYIPASGSVYFDLSALETDMLYRIVVVIDNTNFYGYFYKEE